MAPPPKSSAVKPPTPPSHGGERRVQCHACWVVTPVGSASTKFTCPACKATRVLNRQSKASVNPLDTGLPKGHRIRCRRCTAEILPRLPCPYCAAQGAGSRGPANEVSNQGSRTSAIHDVPVHQVTGLPKANPSRASALHNFIDVLKANMSRAPAPQKVTGLPKANPSAASAPHKVICVPKASPSAASAPNKVIGVPKANLLRASAPHHVTGFPKANPSGASVPHHTSDVPKANPSRVSAPRHITSVFKPDFSRASAPHHVTGLSKANPSSVSAPHHVSGVSKAKPPSASSPHHATGPPKANLRCTICKATINPAGARRNLCSACAAEYDSHVPETVNELLAEVEEEEDEGGTVTETFTDYRPSRLSIGLLHPDPIVETSSLSGVTTPEPKYNLRIEGHLERSKALSCLQIETLVYASQRHLQHLQDGTRAGFLIGDGAGVGKGRTVAGLIWENWCHSRIKALWISIGSDLKFDARRDLDDVGAECIEVHALNKLPYSKLDSESVGVRDGVIFLTYNSLIASSAKGYSRLKQLVEWCGPGYDGLIIFDECHKAKNLIPEGSMKPTLTGKAVKKIQKKLPEARVVYCSATGASEPRNMAYMVRLGLWGHGTCFRNFTDFTRALNKGGVGALELVAMDMKARGMYLCRTLSYKGAEFEVVEAPLNVAMVETYKAAVELWVALREELLRSPSQPITLWMSYWSAHQKFFKHMCMSAKVPTIVRLAKQALSEGKSVVIGLQSTGEARTEDAVAKYGSELDDFISGPHELLLKFVEGHCNLSENPVQVQGKENAKVLKRKRNSATPGVSAEGWDHKVAKTKFECEDNHVQVQGKENAKVLKRKRNSATPCVSAEGWDHKVAKMKFECEEESVPEFHGISKDSKTHIKTSKFADKILSGTCEICYYQEGMNKLLQCTTCGQLAHPACLDPPVAPARAGKWSCYSCELEPNGNKGFPEGKSSLIDKLRSLDLPKNPLDDIIDQLGGPDKVAEITGRRSRLVRNSSGEGVSYQARNTTKVSKDMVNMHEKQQFMDGNKLIAIISEAGSAGVSLQADRRAANQRRRVHLTLELPWSADRAIQQFGRTHRSNQASAPQYRLLFTDLGGERRFAATVANRLESLGALTQGDRRAGPSLSAYNYISKYGREALMIVYLAILERAPFAVAPPGCSFQNPDSIKDYIARARTALVSVGIITECNGGQNKSFELEADMQKVERFLNRLLGMPPEIQNSLFELFVTTLEHVIKDARLLGTFDKGVIDYKARFIKLRGTPKTVYVDRTSGASAKLYRFKVDRGITWETAFALLAEKQNSGSSSLDNGFYESGKGWMGRRHILLAYESSTSGMYKIHRPYEETAGEMSLKELQRKYTKIEHLERAQTGWEDEHTVSSKQCVHGPNCKNAKFCTNGRRLRKVFVLGGVIIPVWNIVQTTLDKQVVKGNRRLQVMHIETTDGTLRLVGFRIPHTAVKSLRKAMKWVQEVADDS